MNKILCMLVGILALLATSLSAAEDWVGHTYMVNVSSAKPFQMIFTVVDTNKVTIKGNKFGRSNKAIVSNVAVRDDTVSFDVAFSGSACGAGSNGTMLVSGKQLSRNNWGSWTGYCAKHNVNFVAKIRKLKLVQ